MTQNSQAIQDCEQAMHQAGVDLPLLKHDTPVFCEPWQAQAFAITLALHERGLFQWSDWAQTLSEVIKEAQRAGDPDRGDTYYEHWLTALERLMTKQGSVSTDSLQQRQQAWREAAARTPHGMPIALATVDRAG
jgi:nitrile hydratase accessory protein